jgi:UDP-glucuronate decarboxylase
MKILVTGGAGFIGSHLCDRLIDNGDEVICMDNYCTGRERNVSHLFDHERFQMINWDIVNPLNPKELEVDQIYNLASPAAPGDYKKDPDATLNVNTIGVQNIINFARELDCPILQTSTVRVLDNTNDCNPYINGKRMAEILLLSYPKAKIARLNTTFGSRMRADDSRVVPAFITKALAGDNLVVYDNKLDKFCHIDSMLDEIVEFMNSDRYGLKELGHPWQMTILDLAKLIITITKSKSRIVSLGEENG